MKRKDKMVKRANEYKKNKPPETFVTLEQIIKAKFENKNGLITKSKKEE